MAKFTRSHINQIAATLKEQMPTVETGMDYEVDHHFFLREWMFLCREFCYMLRDNNQSVDADKFYYACGIENAERRMELMKL